MKGNNWLAKNGFVGLDKRGREVERKRKKIITKTDLEQCYADFMPNHKIISHSQQLTVLPNLRRLLHGNFFYNSSTDTLHRRLTPCDDIILPAYLIDKLITLSIITLIIKNG